MPGIHLILALQSNVSRKVIRWCVWWLLAPVANVSRSSVFTLPAAKGKEAGSQKPEARLGSDTDSSVGCLDFSELGAHRYTDQTGFRHLASGLFPPGPAKLAAWEKELGQSFPTRKVRNFINM